MASNQTRITIRALGVQRITRKFTGVAANAGHMEPAFEIIAEILRHEYEEQFETEGEHAGTPWIHLTEERVEQKRRQGLSDKILQASEDLKNSLTQGGDQNAVLYIGNVTMGLGSKLRYGKMHDRGLGRNPRRQITALTLSARASIHEVMAMWIIHGKAPLFPTKGLI